MPKLVATKELFYAGKTRNVGDEFDASDKDAKILKAIGKASDPAPKRGRQVETAALAPAPAPKKEEPPVQQAEAAAATEEFPLRRRYQRRGLRPEE